MRISAEFMQQINGKIKEVHNLIVEVTSCHRLFAEMSDVAYQIHSTG
jgi:hypothetical protein